MVFPDSEEIRRQWIVAMGVSLLKEGGERFADFAIPDTPAFILKTLAAAPNWETLQRECLERVEHARIAADILLTVLSLGVSAPEEATIRKAIWLEGIILVRQGKGRLASSPTTLKSIWSRFKCVSHLWAAVSYELAHDRGQSFVADLSHFLSVAEQFRRLGETHVPPGGRNNSIGVGGSVLDPSTTWRVPEELALPTVKVKLPRLRSEILEELRGYRADR